MSSAASHWTGKFESGSLFWCIITVCMLYSAVFIQSSAACDRNNFIRYVTRMRVSLRNSCVVRATCLLYVEAAARTQNTPYREATRYVRVPVCDWTPASLPCAIDRHSRRVSLQRPRGGEHVRRSRVRLRKQFIFSNKEN